MPHFSTESRDRLAASIDGHNYRIVAKETWGHLAPKKNITYRGVIRFAVGIYGDDDLNPTTLKCDLRCGDEELGSSPWFYNTLTDLLSEWASADQYGSDPLPAGWPKVEAGGVYEWRGTFRNYRFRGKLRRIELM